MLLAITLFGGVVGCSSTNDTSPSAGDTASSSTSSSTTTSSSQQQQQLFVSFVAETEPGQAPALVHLDNATAFVVTLQVGGANFLQIAIEDVPTLEPQLAVSADVLADTKIGYHEDKSEGAACVFLTLDELTGPNQLEAGVSYSLEVTGDSYETLALKVVELGPAPAFVAVRGWRKAQIPGTTTLELTPAGASTPQLFDLSLGSVGQYVSLGTTNLQLEAISFETPSQTFSAQDSATLSGAFGFTAVVDDEELANAATAVELTAD